MGATVGLTLYSLWAGGRERSKATREQREQRERGIRSDMQGYWETYQKWGQEAATGYEQSVTSLKARMAAGGVKAGSEQWEINVAGIKAEHEAKLEGFKTGVTGSALAEWTTTQQAAVMGTDPETGEEYVTKEAGALGMSEYLTQEFGALDLTPEAPSAREAAATTARQEAAGTAPAASPTGTPWW